MRFAALPLLLGLACFGNAQERIRDVVYQKQGGVAFTLDVFKPAKPNGITVIHLVSGGWVSDHSGINPSLAQAANAAGYTMVQVVHGAQPRFKVPEIVGQVQRAIRYLRANASQFGIDPDRIGLTGGSAGGHLALMVGALHADGNPNALDPVERFPARVGAIGVFFPPTDFTNYGREKLFAFDNRCCAKPTATRSFPISRPPAQIFSPASQRTFLPPCGSPRTRLRF
jgi:acetyl esterase/lipase